MSLASAVVVGAVGALGLRYVRRPGDLVLATLPVAFAVHQASEAVTWTQLTQAEAATCAGPSVRVWVLFAWVLLPVWLAAGITLAEPDPDRRRAQTWLTGLAGLAAVGWATQALDPAVIAFDAGGHLSYPLPDLWAGLLVGTYVFVVVVPGLLSSWPLLRLLAVAGAVTGLVSFVLSRPGWPSLWCLAAAFLSMVVVAHLRSAAAPVEPVGPSGVRPAAVTTRPHARTAPDGRRPAPTGR